MKTLDFNKAWLWMDERERYANEQYFLPGFYMTIMHANELKINEGLVRSLIDTQCPHWAKLLLKAIPSSSTDNALFRLGNDYVVRLPRIEWQPGSIVKTINKEYQWLPQIAQFLTVSISVPIFKGKPDQVYPWPWTVTKWNEGHNPDYERENEYESLAKDLAYFLNELHGIKLANGPYSRRGVTLIELDEETMKALRELKGEIEIDTVRNLWKRLINVKPFLQEPVWIHGDFLPGNILIQNNRLSAVVDFSDVGIGDPACGLVIACRLLNSHSRNVFKNSLVNIDDDTWERGKGWALSIALIMLPYYKNSNPTLASLARRMIKVVLHSQKI